MHLAHSRHRWKMTCGAQWKLAQQYPNNHGGEHFIYQIGANHRDSHRLNQTLANRVHPATNKSAPLPVTPPNKVVRIGTATTVTAGVMITPLNTTFGKVRNHPARASHPATSPITMATGAKAAAIGSVSNPHSRLVSNPVNIPTIGPNSTALIMVPMESRK